MRISRGGGVRGAGSCPAIRHRIVSSARVENVGAIIPAPDDHFTASPGRGVIAAERGRISGSSSYPTVRARIVPPQRSLARFLARDVREMEAARDLPQGASDE